jgi:hypothetical protein
MDTGEERDGKKVYRSSAIGGIKGDAGTDALGEVSASLKNLLNWSVKQITVTRVEELKL